LLDRWVKRPPIVFCRAIGNRSVPKKKEAEMARTKMGVVGCGGRMGRMLVAEIAPTEGCAIAGGSEAPGSGYVNQDIGEPAGIGRMGIPIGETVEKLIRDGDVVLEFTSPAATVEHAALAAEIGKAMVIGTTGLSAKQGEAVRQIPIVWAPNMILGVNVLLSAVEEVARLGPTGTAQSTSTRSSRLWPARHATKIPSRDGKGLYRAGLVEERHE
jgi:hypothetical protein